MSPSPYGACPNCHGDEIVRVPHNPSAGHQGQLLFISAFRHVPVASMVCLSCGYVRQWVDNRASLDLLREKFGDQLEPR